MPPTYTSTGTAGPDAFAGTTTFHWETPITNPGAEPAYWTSAVLPPITADGVKIGDSTLELERDDLTKLSGTGLSEVTFGIRPEQLELADSGGVEVVVDLVEDLGSEAYVYTHAGSGVELVARCNPRTAPKLADTVRLHRHPEGVVHLFHPQTGERLN